jgi:hypothetical protein
VGRDYGVQVRGYPGKAGKQHFEYRLVVFQGVRGVEARNTLRVVGRVAYYPFAAETGFFYGGTFQGTRRLVGLGASVDRQKQYGVYGADAFVEQPIKKGQQGITAQFNWMRFDGGAFLTALPKQDTYLLEAGYHFLKGTLTPLVQYAMRDFSSPLTADQNSLQAGVAIWMAAHTRNLKFTAGRAARRRQAESDSSAGAGAGLLLLTSTIFPWPAGAWSVWATSRADLLPSC